MGYGNPTAFFTVIFKITLSIQIRIIADYFNSALVSSACAIAAKSPELASYRSFAFGYYGIFYFK
jgi:hypothetical protein